MKFTDIELHPDLMKGISQLGFIECTPVQERVFGYTLRGADVIVQSQTGTGKTAAFLITIFQHLLTDEKYKGKRALVIAPTRELADQIERDANQIGHFLPLKIGSFYGGVGYTTQERLLAEGVDLMIGTPGRLLDYAKQRKLDFHDVGLLVIDEADRLFDMGFYLDIRRMLRAMLPREQRLTMLLSATMSTRATTLAWEHMNDPAQIVIESESVTVDTISQHLYHVSGPEKMSLLLGIMKKWNPGSVLIFANTKHKVEELSKRLDANGYKSQFIIGDLPQRKRLRIIEDLKSGLVPILVATDVAARGLHVEDLDMVVNYDLPEDPENYVHRIGRTARAGKSGTTVALACDRYVYGLDAIEKFINMKIPVETVDESIFVQDKSAGMNFRDSYTRDRKHDGRGGRGGDRGGRRDAPRRGRGPRYESERGRPAADRPPAERQPSERRDRNRPGPQRGGRRDGAPAAGERRGGERRPERPAGQPPRNEPRAKPAPAAKAPAPAQPVKPAEAAPAPAPARLIEKMGGFIKKIFGRK